MGSEKKKMRCWVLIVFMLVVAGSCELGWCWGDAFANAKEHLNIAANWAQEKFAGGGVNKETTDGVKDRAAEAAGTVNTAASDASKYASDKADQVGGIVSGGQQDSSRSTLEEEEDKGRSSSSDDKFDDLQNSYDETVKKVGESYNSAKNTISDNTKQTYESAKEMASDAAANVGAKINSRQQGDL